MFLTYAHDGGEVVLGGRGNLLTGRPDVLYGGVQVTQLGRDGPLIHCSRYHRNNSESTSVGLVMIKLGE